MKISRLWTLLLVAMLANGCVVFHHQKKTAVPAPAKVPAASTTATTNASATAFKPIITPDNSLSAKVADYNSAGRFVVLTFPVGAMPKMDQTMFLYRNGLKVGEIKITGPEHDNDVVADLVTGTAQVGDEVRSQ